MVYISSSAFTNDKIKETVLQCVELGILNIELSGETKSYPGMEDDLLNLKRSFSINFLLHSYFPPMEDYPDFVMNVAASEETERKKTLDVIKNAIRLSKKLGSNLYTIHPGFDFSLYEKGGVFYKKLNFIHKQNTKEDFYRSVDSLLNHHLEDDFKLGIENFFPLKGEFSSFIQSQDDIFEFLNLYKKTPGIGLLLDFGHLNVAANFFGFNKYNFIDKLFSNYPDKIFEIHMSENAGVYDSHNISEKDSWQIDMVTKNKFLHDKPVVFEWRGCPSSLISQSFAALMRHIEDRKCSVDGISGRS